MVVDTSCPIAYPLITYNLRRVALWRQARIRGFLKPSQQHASLLAQLWRHAFPILLVLCVSQAHPSDALPAIPTLSTVPMVSTFNPGVHDCYGQQLFAGGC
ncbi:hypothetical protein M422DRAFT_254792 [Sphaerobolus stellatus SS14]|uniref:Uncharacterized protein n=1 Tax=Sphaerobolus stellatus (strain SS14) TaxID=990650 RepID=A0A0C9VU60_SPHS4|nr:hypothetical protein M422DRAFT_254792 [Sphaerobolus stellatus SS14]